MILGLITGNSLLSGFSNKLKRFTNRYDELKPNILEGNDVFLTLKYGDLEEQLKDINFQFDVDFKKHPKYFLKELKEEIGVNPKKINKYLNKELL